MTGGWTADRRIALRCDRSAKRTALAVAILAAMLAGGGPATVVHATPLGTRDLISVEPRSSPAHHRLKLLSDADVARYSDVLALQDKGDWRAADRVIKRLSDRVLMGRVLYQRYMHPTKYRSRYTELANWLKRYADQPGAVRVWKLAMRRKPRAAKAPRRPVGKSAGAAAATKASPDPASRSIGKRNATQRRHVRKLRLHMLRHIRRGDPKGAAKHLRHRDVERLFQPVEFDEMRRQVAAAYFFKGHDKQALTLAAASAERSRLQVPAADWTAGIAAWRLADRAAARHHFEALAHSPTASPWNVAAGAFWGARASLVMEEPEHVNDMLAIAAGQPRTFYGLVAARLLARDPPFRWTPPPLEAANMDRMMKHAPVRRSLALTQVGQIYWAERELRDVHAALDQPLKGALLGLASRLGLAAAALRFSAEMSARGEVAPDSTAYPVPRWRPVGGFEIDRALIFAFMRQESGFNSRAKSRSGAYGLMQLMPRTGSFIAKDRSLRGRNKRKLFLPELNIDLGQKYLRHLIEDHKIRGNLFMVAAAYNGGPGNLAKWLRRMNHHDDPLLFIESLPSLETRLFVERVFANFWIYRARLGQASPSLDAVASGHWPQYFALDDSVVTLAERAQVTGPEAVPPVRAAHDEY